MRQAIGNCYLVDWCSTVVVQLQQSLTACPFAGVYYIQARLYYIITGRTIEEYFSGIVLKPDLFSSRARPGCVCAWLCLCLDSAARKASQRVEASPGRPGRVNRRPRVHFVISQFPRSMARKLYLWDRALAVRVAMDYSQMFLRISETLVKLFAGSLLRRFNVDGLFIYQHSMFLAAQNIELCIEYRLDFSFAVFLQD